MHKYEKSWSQLRVQNKWRKLPLILAVIAIVLVIASIILKVHGL